MSIGNSYHPTVKPKVTKDGRVNTSEDVKNDGLLTYDFLCKQPRGFLDVYWPVVAEIYTWIFIQLGKGNHQNYSHEFAAARVAGSGSHEYEIASNKIRAMVNEWTNANDRTIGTSLNRKVLMQLVVNEILGMSILEPIWKSKKVKEVYVNGPKDIQVETDNGLSRVPGASFRDQAHALDFCTKFLADYNKSLDTTNAIAESRLSDGSRFEATHPCICPAGPNIDIRRHDSRHWTVSDIVATGMASKEMLIDLERYIRLGLSMLVSGGTSTGKTTVLNALTGLFPNEKRILTIEDTLELNVNPNKLLAAPLEARPAGLNGKGEITIRKLVKTALRLSPQIIIIGETRGAEAYDLVDAANTGHQVFSTIHANNASHAISRVEMAISQGGELVGTETLGAIQSAFAIIIEIKKFLSIGSGRTRRIITGIHEVAPHITQNAAGEPELKTIPLWVFKRDETDDNEIKGTWIKVNELSEERINTLPNYAFEKPKTWHEILQLEHIAAKDRMIATDAEDENGVGGIMSNMQAPVHNMQAPIANNMSNKRMPAPVNNQQRQSPQQQPRFQQPVRPQQQQRYNQQMQAMPPQQYPAPQQRPMVPPVMHTPQQRQ